MAPCTVATQQCIYLWAIQNMHEIGLPAEGILCFALFFTTSPLLGNDRSGCRPASCSCSHVPQPFSLTLIYTTLHVKIVLHSILRRGLGALFSAFGLVFKHVPKQHRRRGRLRGHESGAAPLHGRPHLRCQCAALWRRNLRLRKNGGEFAEVERGYLYRSGALLCSVGL